MPFFVYGQDNPGVGAQLGESAEAHWAYMDQFADRLILRGPTLSDDGTEHTGSVHVVDLADRVSADRFATEEPFWRAGLYRHVTTIRIIVTLDREIAREVPHALVTGEWPPRPREDTRELDVRGLDDSELDDRVRFAGLLVDDDQVATTGIVAVVRAPQDEAASVMQPLADQLAGAPAALTAQCWERGGRR
jgi:uncharacterized protein